MPRRDPDQRSPATGGRVSLRRALPAGGQGDLVGFVVAAGAEELVVRDRHGIDHTVPWRDVAVLRPIGVARGRDPLRTPVAELDRLAAAAGATGRAFVARLSDLLDGAPPAPLAPWADPPPVPASLAGEWVTTATVDDVVELAWWASRHDARSIQVRAATGAAADRLAALGFTEVTA